MQTFLPFAHFHQSAVVLDRQRLGKQRVENLQILKALIDPAYGWQNHPAVRMWRDFEGALVEYQEAICGEWHQVRGYKDTCLDKTYALADAAGIPRSGFACPWWLGNPDFHRSHKSNLIRKAPEIYRPLFPDVPDDLEYVWPV
jgi:hypothetical protein